jgi:cell wall-associated NlpC family hydrolase
MVALAVVARRPRWLRLVTSVCVLFATVVVAAGPAGASPQTDLLDKTAQAKSIVSAIAAAGKRADLLDEQYLAARNAAALAHKRIAATQQRIVESERHAAELRARLQARAAALYMNAGTADPLAINASSVRDVTSRAQYGDAASAHDTALLDSVKQVTRRLDELRETLEQQQSSAQAHKRAAADAAAGLRKNVAQQKLLLHSINTDIKTLVAQITLERAAALQQAARIRLAKVFPTLVAASDKSAALAALGINPSALPAPTPGAAAALAFARAQLGKPYVYAAAGPNSFDCSGLTMVAWAHGGVAMVHHAADQYATFPKVPLDQLQPGDLVFYGNPIHHVGMYVGAGMMIEAPHTGAFVRYASIVRDDLVLLGVRPTNKPTPPAVPKR